MYPHTRIYLAGLSKGTMLLSLGSTARHSSTISRLLRGRANEPPPSLQLPGSVRRLNVFEV